MRPSESEPLGMPSATETRTRLDAEGLAEAEHEVAINWQGVLHLMQTEPVPPLTMLGSPSRTPCAIRVGETIIRREPGEGLDHLRLRVAREHGALGAVGHYCYPRAAR